MAYPPKKRPTMREGNDMDAEVQANDKEEASISRCKGELNQGKLLVVTSGDYTGQKIHGLYQVQVECDTSELYHRYATTATVDAEGAVADPPEMFLQWIVVRGYFQKISAEEFPIGRAGRLWHEDYCPEACITSQVPLQIAYDLESDVLTVNGIKFAGGVMRQFAKHLPPGALFRLVARKDGALVLERVPDAPGQE